MAVDNRGMQTSNGTKYRQYSCIIHQRKYYHSKKKVFTFLLLLLNLGEQNDTYQSVFKYVYIQYIKKKKIIIHFFLNFHKNLTNIQSRATPSTPYKTLSFKIMYVKKYTSSSLPVWVDRQRQKKKKIIPQICYHSY